ncbi:hypothetical protein ACLOJK_002224 [Asimina triloba]
MRFTVIVYCVRGRTLRMAIAKLCVLLRYAAHHCDSSIWTVVSSTKEDKKRAAATQTRSSFVSKALCGYHVNAVPSNFAGALHPDPQTRRKKSEKRLTWMRCGFRKPEERVSVFFVKTKRAVERERGRQQVFGL